MVRFLAETMPAVTVFERPKGAADGEHPVADLRAVGVAQLDGGQRFLGVDLDDGDVGVLVDADDLGGTAVDRLASSGSVESLTKILSALSTT